LSQAVAYGDDYQAATNYPLVRFTNNATHHVFYARTHSHSTMAVATGSALVYTEFDVPIRIERGPSSLVVVANGIASKPVEVDVSAVTPLATPTATRTPLPTAAATATSTPSPRAPVASNSNGNGGGSTVWLAFFTLATGWSLFQLLKNLARTRDE
jgi:cell division septation protein DedD